MSDRSSFIYSHCVYMGKTRPGMEQIQPYLDYFSANPGWALAVVFLIAFGEALLIIGLFVPSTVILVSAGMLVSSRTGQASGMGSS
jgi:membrane protein DedA with SNARE-associated domain